jgi:hypothetical protein
VFNGHPRDAGSASGRGVAQEVVERVDLFERGKLSGVESVDSGSGSEGGFAASAPP